VHFTTNAATIDEQSELQSDTDETSTRVTDLSYPIFPEDPDLLSLFSSLSLSSNVCICSDLEQKSTSYYSLGQGGSFLDSFKENDLPRLFRDDEQNPDPFWQDDPSKPLFRDDLSENNMYNPDPFWQDDLSEPLSRDDLGDKNCDELLSKPLLRNDLCFLPKTEEERFFYLD